MHPAIGNTVILSLKFADSSITPKIVDKLINEMSAFHLKTDYKYVYPTNRKPVVNLLPHFDKLPDVNQYAVDNLLPDITETLGTISANDDTILLAINHLCGDGGYMKGVLDHLFDPPKKLDSLYPLAVDDVYKKYMDKYSHIKPKIVNNDPELTIVKPQHPKSGNDQIDILREPISSLACYNKEKGVCSFLNESICMSLIMSHIVADGRTQSYEEMTRRPHGIQILMDLRKRFPIKPTLNSFNWWASYNIHAHPTLSMKVGDVYKELRKDLQDSTKDQRLFDFHRANSITDPTPASAWDTRVFPNNSNLGQMVIKEPLKDLFFTNTFANVPARNMSALLTYSVIDQHGRNELFQILRYGSNGFDKKFAQMINKSVQYYLQHITPNQTFKEALEMIKKYQMSIYH